MPMTPSCLVVWRGEGTARSEAEAKGSPQVKMGDEPSCDSVKDAGSVFLSQWPINVNTFLKKSRDSRTKANRFPEYLPFRPHGDRICMPPSTKSSETLKGSTSKAFGPSELSCLGWDICCPWFRLGEDLVEKAALLGQGSPKGRQAWDLWSRDKLSSGKCGYASSGGYCCLGCSEAGKTPCCLKWLTIFHEMKQEATQSIWVGD